MPNSCFYKANYGLTQKCFIITMTSARMVTIALLFLLDLVLHSVVIVFNVSVTNASFIVLFVYFLLFVILSPTVWLQIWSICITKKQTWLKLDHLPDVDYFSAKEHMQPMACPLSYPVSFRKTCFLKGLSFVMSGADYNFGIHNDVSNTHLLGDKLWEKPVCTLMSYFVVCFSLQFSKCL